MIELNVLGGIRLQPDDDREVPLPQPKRLALLCYLTIASPGRYRTRDDLLAMFWPESDRARARASLRKAVHSLRRALGRDAVQGEGDRLRAGLERLSCDAIRFERAIDRGAVADAMEHYGGELMEGFHVSDVPAFQGWLDLERQRLRQLALAAAGELSDDAESHDDLRSAAYWAQRAVRIAPFNEAAVRRAAALHWRLGDRIGGIRTLQLLVRRLEDEWEVAPSEETVALMSEMRATRRARRSSGPALAVE